MNNLEWLDDIGDRFIDGFIVGSFYYLNHLGSLYNDNPYELLTKNI
jgi:hypothetical protein